MTQAARLGDAIGHSHSMSGLLLGLLLGAEIAIIGVAIVGTGGLAAVAIIGGAAAAGASLGDFFSTMSWAPKDVCGFIVGACSANVFTNGIPAARAYTDAAQCSKHSLPHPPIATGSGTVFINGLPAARVDDKIACGAAITAGSNNVFIGGETVQTDAISPEELVPAWVHMALFVVGLASAITLVGPVLAIGGMIAGAAGSKLGEALGRKAFGSNSDGQKWSMLASSLVGGFLGAKAAPKTWAFVKHLEVQPGTLGMSGANIRMGLRSYKEREMDPGYIGEHLPGNRAPNWIEYPESVLVKYFETPEARAKFELHFKDGKAYDSKGQLFDTDSGYGGRAIFVMDKNGKIYASCEHEVGTFHHSSFLGGRPVAAAGEFEATEGIITVITDRSGHYKPTRGFMLQAVEELKIQGVDMRFVIREF